MGAHNKGSIIILYIPPATLLLLREGTVRSWVCPEPKWPARQRHHHHHHRLARQGYLYNKQVNFSARLVPFISQGFLHTHATSRMTIDKKKSLVLRRQSRTTKKKTVKSLRLLEGGSSFNKLPRFATYSIATRPWIKPAACWQLISRGPFRFAW